MANKFRVAVLSLAVSLSVSCSTDPTLSSATLVVNSYDGERYSIMQSDGNAPATCDAVWTYAAHGARLYTVVRRPNEQRGYHPQVCDLSDGSSVTANIVVYDSHVGFSPEGSVLTAERRPDGTIDLLLLSSDLNSNTQLDRPGTLNSDPDWSPDGQFWVYRSDRDGRINLWLEHVESGNTVRLTDNQHLPSQRGYGGIGPGRFSPDGQQVVYSCVDADGRSQLCLTQSDGRSTRQLTQGTSQTNGMYPAWHPSGDRIVFGADDPDGEGYALFEIRLSDNHLDRIEQQPAQSNLGAVWLSR